MSILRSAFLIVALGVGPAGAQHHHGEPSTERLGKVEFETSCDPSVRPAFNRAVALLHSFWWRAAADGFQSVLERDPSCGIAYWGLALSHWGNPFAGLRPPEALEPGAEAIARGLEVGAKTERERAYLRAAAELYRDFRTTDQRTRTLAYEAAMAKLVEAYPADREAAAFYALAINQNALPTDKTYAKQLKAAAILERLFRDQPDHPGLAHYIIHAYDHPPLAPKALEAARRYAKIAPDAPHALHMPSHTFTRVGYWQDSIESNRASAEAARRANSPGEVLHALDYQAYAYLQTAQDRAARRVVEEMQAAVAAMGARDVYLSAGQFAQAAIPARYALERGAWREAAALAPVQTRVPWIAAVTHFARAIGAARSGDPAAAREDLAALEKLQQALAGKDDYWAEQVAIQHLAAGAWVLFAEGRRDEAIAELRAAADREDATDKSAISPGPLAPARELLGEMLLEAGRPAEALEAFTRTMEKEPNRFRSLAGAARAAAVAGDRAQARALYRRLLDLAAPGDGDRPELAEARRAVSASGG
jgi:tetratricopeptide (TPR) repeat protein